MNILIGSLVRDRGWILPRFLKGIYELNFDKKNISLYFLVNDSIDKSKEVLEGFKYCFGDKYRNIIIEEKNLGTQIDKRIGDRKPIYKVLAELRNNLLDKGKNYDFLFSVDSDIILYPEDLNNLVAANKDIVSGIINNGSPQIFNLMTVKLNSGYPVHYKNWQDEKEDVFEIDVTGAVILISKEVCSNIAYEYHERGEDLGFCKNAQSRGYRIYAHKKVTPLHIMNKEQICQSQQT